MNDRTSIRSATETPGSSAAAAARIALALFLSLLAAGCSPPLSGIYADASGATQYEFRSDGKVYISVLGATASGNYEANADRVLITGPQGTVVLIRNRDQLLGPMGLELTRKTPEQVAPSPFDNNT